ncbi:MAG: class I SAM-dependent methyltransferase [Bacteroidetes bacterium]|nr:class I SAM-dependent methyltransferase [Bacteroidota bacterium]
MKNYFSKHYAILNNIDLNSEDSILDWYKLSFDYYDKFLKQHLKLSDDKKILELGCGIGGLLYFLKKSGCENYLGVDISEEQLSICQKYVTTKVLNEDVLSFLKNHNHKYDLIVLLDLIEHLGKDKIIQFIELLYKTLDLNGRILLRTPNMGSLFGLRSRYIDFTHEVGFTEESIKQVFNQSDFSKVQVHNTYIGKKRLFAVKCYQKMFEKLYNINLSNIVTQDLILVAEKGN